MPLVRGVPGTCTGRRPQSRLRTPQILQEELENVAEETSGVLYSAYCPRNLDLDRKMTMDV